MRRQLIADGPRSVLYREDRESGAVVLKLLKPEHLSSETLLRFNNELHITKRLNIDGVRQAIQKVQVDGKHGLELHFIPGSPPPLGPVHGDEHLLQVLRLGAALASILQKIHAVGVVHRDIKPANLIIDPDTLAVTLIDFGSATEVRHHRANTPHRGAEGTLAYMSPEQTGRTNRPVDSRTDLYSLGITLYELITGELPFQSTDPLELVHSHIARRAPPLGPSIPAQVREIVEHLLEKSADDRYQTAAGLHADLQHCIRALEQDGEITSFELGKHDAHSVFRIPDRLYGREEQLNELLRAFDLASSGPSRLVLVGGFSGIGKSKLIHELDPYVVERRGYFACGKCERLLPTPYLGLVQALTQLADHLLTEDEHTLSQTRDRISAQLGDLCAIITELVPAIEGILGAQQPLPQLGPDETMSRFTSAIKAFFRALCLPEHPVVVFLDDLQWADYALLDLFESLLEDTETQALLFIGAYRNNELEHTHPLQQFIHRLHPRLSVESIQLSSLTAEHTYHLLQDTFQSEAVGGLAKLTTEKTGGNPYFIRQFIADLVRKEQIFYDGREWRWDIHAIQRLGITDNVAVLLTDALAELPSATLNLLKISACIGTSVEMGLLGSVTHTSPTDAARGLWPAVRAGHLLPVNRLLGAALDETVEIDPHTAVVFSHDRVRQAAYALIADATLLDNHLRIGEALLKESTGTDDHLFEVVHHLNIARSRFPDTSLLARLNIEAGALACRSAAHREGLNHYLRSRDLLQGTAWNAEQYTLSLGAAQAAYRTGDLELSLEFANTILAHTSSPLERIDAHLVGILCAMGRDDLSEALRIGKQALSELGETFPSTPKGMHIGLALAKTKWMLLGKTAESLQTASEMTDPHKQRAMSVLEKVLPAAFRASSNLFPLFVLRLVQLTLRHGTSPVSSFAWAGYSIMLAGILGDLNGAKQFGELSLHISKTHAQQHPALRSKALFVHNNMVRHWHEPLSESIPGLTESARLALEAGAVWDWVWAVFYRILWMFITTSDIPQVEHELALQRQTLQQDAGADLERRLIAQVLHNLHTPDIAEPWLLNGPIIDDSTLRARIQNTDDRTEAVLYHLLSGWLANLFGQHENALSHLAVAESELEAVIALPLVPWVHLETNLARCALARSGKTGSLRPVQSALKKLKSWSISSPKNYRHKHVWLRAELAWARGDRRTASECFQTALNDARASGFCSDEARILESAQSFYRAHNNLVLAEALHERCLVAYRAWGAINKVNDLLPAAPLLLTGPTSHNTGQGIGTNSSTGTGTHTQLDLASLMKAAAAITSTLDLDQLLIRVLNLLAENTGATNGAIVLPHAEHWVIEYDFDIDEGCTKQSAPLSQTSNICAAAVRFVTRSGKPLVIDTAAEDPRFRSYATAYGVEALLVVPITQKGKIQAIAYFEHRQASGAFTPDRVSFVELLASQAAIGVENALLHQKVEDAFAAQVELNRARRRFVPQRFLDGLGRQSIADVTLGDAAEKDMGILFSDIRSFTTLIEGMTAVESIEFINQYLSHMEPAIHRNSGFVDSYIGDAIMALFEGSTDGAVRAAIEMLQSLHVFNRDRAEKNHPPVHMGIGISYGRVMMGTIGGKNRLKCGVIGDSVNLGARIESMTKLYGVSLLISDTVRSAISYPDRFHLRQAARVLVKGKTEPVQVWEVFDADPRALREQKLASLPLHDSALNKYYRADFSGAIRDLEELAQRLPGDPLINVQLQDARQLLHSGVPHDWDGASVLNHK